MAATIGLQKAKHVPYTPGKIRKYICTDSQTMYKGDFVQLVSGKVSLCPATSTTDVATDLFGMLMNDVTNSDTNTTAIAYVLVAEGGTRFMMNYIDSTTAESTVGIATSLALNNAPLPLMYRGAATARKWFAAKAHTVGIYTIAANQMIVVESLAQRDAVGDLGGRLICKIKDSIIE